MQEGLSPKQARQSCGMPQNRAPNPKHDFADAVLVYQLTPPISILSLFRRCSSKAPPFPATPPPPPPPKTQMSSARLRNSALKTASNRVSTASSHTFPVHRLYFWCRTAEANISFPNSLSPWNLPKVVSINYPDSGGRTDGFSMCCIDWVPRNTGCFGWFWAVL